MAELPPPSIANDSFSDSKRVQRLEFVVKQSKVLASILSQKLEKKQEELKNAEVKQKAKEEKKDEVKETKPAVTATATRTRRGAASKHIAADDEPQPTRTTRRAATSSAAAPASTTTGKRRGRPPRAQPTSQPTITSLIDKRALDDVTKGASTTELLASAALEDNDGKLGATNLKSARQPALITGAIMKDYQLEGLDWLVSLYENGLNGILADEMGLGKTIQTIGLLAFLREKGTLGPFLVVGPVSTLSNWVDEIKRFAPTMPVLLYHGSVQERAELRSQYLNKKVDEKWPIVCTSYDIIMRDKQYLQRIAWKYIIIDEGHRLKNLNCKLIRELKSYTSANRLLLTGTPLQNNLSELWSLLNFLLPDIFDDLDAFQEWFDFSALQEKEGRKHFLEQDKKTQIVSSLHAILKPFLLRRIKADVNLGLPPKREYVLYAPLTQSQKDLYQALLDNRGKEYVIQKIMELRGAGNPNAAVGEAAVETELSKAATSVVNTPVELDGDTASTASGSITSYFTAKGRKRKAPREIRELSSPPNKMPRTSPGSSNPGTPSSSIPGTPTLGLGNLNLTGGSNQLTLKPLATAKRKKKALNYREPTDREWYAAMEAAESKQRLGSPLAALEGSPEPFESAEEDIYEQNLKDAARLAGSKKWANPVMQLRLVCNHPYMFYQPWAHVSDSSEDIDWTDPKYHPDSRIITESGKMRLLDRLLPELFNRGHKVIIFSQFTAQLDLLQDYADLKGWPICRIDGSTAQDDRKQQIKDFNEDSEYRLFLVSTKAGGLGINLTAADTVILFDSDWNPQADLQAMDRAHRIGQKRPVLVFRLATANTIEQTILERADAKRRLERLVIKKGAFKSLIEKTEKKDDEEELREILDKEEFEKVSVVQEGDVVLGDEELEVLLDRSDEAYKRAERGEGGKNFKAVKGSGGAE